MSPRGLQKRFMMCQQVLGMSLKIQVKSRLSSIKLWVEIATNNLGTLKSKPFEQGWKDIYDIHE